MITRCGETVRDGVSVQWPPTAKAALPRPGRRLLRVAEDGLRKQPYAIGMADGEPFTLAGLWENWKDPDSASGSAPSPS
jgi:putative SOS response-associated peptidase YedK